MIIEDSQRCFDHKVSSPRSVSLDVSLQQITSVIVLLDQAGEVIAAAHLQAAFDVLSGYVATAMASAQENMFH
ncbi:hypothetical protein [Novosphingobium sp.]|uniref:hypothetical protein n=1 Tax=Novosphingobium sp. TaxID=1874826 RepID=UPI003D10F9D0